jgi:hypothetical protein
MNIASRTPEGEPNRCPICNHAVCVEHSRIFGDACCPHCGTLLWHVSIDGDSVIFDHDQARPTRERVIAALSKLLAVDPQTLADNPPRWDELAADSLDIAELVLELEEELD